MNLLSKIKSKIWKKENLIVHDKVDFDHAEYKHQMTLVNLAEMGVSMESIQSYDNSIKKINELSKAMDSYNKYNNK